MLSVSDKDKKRKTGGTGLGLLISKQIITSHEGKIWAESQFGEGSTFNFTLPIMDGYEVCEKIKSDDALKKIPIIFLTASSTIKIQEAAKQFNVEDYLIKPFEPQQLIEKVKGCIG